MKQPKKLTRAMKDMLIKKKLDPDNYRYIKTETIDTERDKSLGRNSIKQSYWVLININTWEEERYEVV